MVTGGNDWFARYHRSLTSRVDYDPSIWFEVPPGIGAGRRAQEWAADLASANWQDSGLRPGEFMVENLAVRLVMMAEIADDQPFSLTVVHLPDPRMEIAFAGVHVLELPQAATTDEALLEFMCTEDPPPMEPPEVEEFVSPWLGRGLRSFRCAVMPPDPDPPPGWRDVDDGTGRPFGIVRYVWRLPAQEAVVLIRASNSDVARLRSMRQDLDNLASAVRVETFEELRSRLERLQVAETPKAEPEAPVARRRRFFR